MMKLDSPEEALQDKVQLLDIKCYSCFCVLTSDNWRKSLQKKNNTICSPCKNKALASWREINRDKISRHNQKYYNNHKEKCLSRNKEYVSKNRDKTNIMKRGHTTKRRALLLKRIPLWSSQETILEFYRNCPPGYHVDHIVPLQGKLVSGLHVETNLQYLPAKENLSKGNKYYGE